MAMRPRSPELPREVRATGSLRDLYHEDLLLMIDSCRLAGKSFPEGMREAIMMWVGQYTPPGACCELDLTFPRKDQKR